MNKPYYVYFMASPSNTALYVGVTNDLFRRVTEHKSGCDPTSFTSKYNCKKLVYFEETESIKAALHREKQFKDWKREWKNAIITKTNPNWRDLSGEIGVTREVLLEIADQVRNDG